MNTKRLYALRGAAQCKNEAEDICRQVADLYDDVLAKNKLAEADIVSLFFTVTGDLNALNPATALRRSGRGGDLALLVAREADFPGILDRTVRMLIHCYLPEGAKPQYVFRNGAEVLRPDLAGS
jgi:chorismate mutase